MLDIDIPGFGHIQLKYLVLDLNGTLTYQGTLIPQVQNLIFSLKNTLEITIISADTFGKAKTVATELGVALWILNSEKREGFQKAQFVEQLGAESVAAIGNGMNDCEMLKKARVSIAVVGPEGAAAENLRTAKVIVHNIVDALNLFINPQMLKATLRF